MSIAQAIVVLCLRLLGGWLVISSVYVLIVSGVMGQLTIKSLQDLSTGSLVNLSSILVSILPGIVLLGFAERIAARAVPRVEEETAPASAASLQNLALVLAGIYCLLQGVPACVLFIWEVVMKTTWPELQPHRNAFRAFAFLTAGYFFLFRTPSVAAWIRQRSAT